jgi:hypothetical protein
VQQFALIIFFICFCFCFFFFILYKKSEGRKIWTRRKIWRRRLSTIFQRKQKVCGFHANETTAKSGMMESYAIWISTSSESSDEFGESKNLVSSSRSQFLDASICLMSEGDVPLFYSTLNQLPCLLFQVWDNFKL